MKLSLESPAPPEVVLESLRADFREWRESLIPEDLRKAGVFRIEGRVQGNRFDIHYSSASEARPEVELHGIVRAGDRGGSQVVASTTGPKWSIVLPLLIVAWGIWDSWTKWSFSVVLGVGLFFVAIDVFIRIRAAHDQTDARYMAERLRGAVERAGTQVDHAAS